MRKGRILAPIIGVAVERAPVLGRPAGKHRFGRQGVQAPAVMAGLLSRPSTRRRLKGESDFASASIKALQQQGFACEARVLGFCHPFDRPQHVDGRDKPAMTPANSDRS